jgi:uncharacterized protein (TIGR02145 family)
MKKTLTQQNDFTDQKVYENLDNEVTATMVNALFKALNESVLPSYELNPGSVAWEPAKPLILPATLTGESNSLQSIPTLGVTVGALCDVIIAPKKYTYQLQASTEETAEPYYIRPADYETGNNENVWVMLDILPYTAENSANKSTNIIADGSSNIKYPGVKAIKDYVDGLVVGLLDYRGGYDASVNTFPSTGGSGTAGAILKGDTWYINTAGTLGGKAVAIGDMIIALIDGPVQEPSNWDILNVGLGYTPENVANKVTSFQATPDDTHYPSEKLVKDSLDAIDESKWQEVSTNVPYNYGYLYNWYAVNTGKLAPTGYSIPSATNIDTLRAYLGATDNVVSDKCRSTRTAPTVDPSWSSNTGATNLTNLGMLPSGKREVYGNFNYIKSLLEIWTTDSVSETNASSLYVDKDWFSTITSTKTAGISVLFFRTATVGEQALADGTIIEYAQDVDGNYYPMVKIGTQVWSQQNLKTTHYNDGSAITNVTDGPTWADLTTEAYCSYNNQPLSTYEDPTFYYTVPTNIIEPKNNKKVLATNIEGLVEELNDLTDVDTTESKTTPIDDDALLLQDSEDSSIWKKLTWGNLKTTIASLFVKVGAATTGQYASLRYVQDIATTTFNIDFANGNVQEIVLTNGANTVAITGMLDGGQYILYVFQPSSGAAGTVTWDAKQIWGNAGAPILTTTNGKLDMISINYNSRIDKLISMCTKGF